jgi:hypothetical protein
VAKNSIGNLSIVLSASTAGLSAGLKRAQALVSGFASGVSRVSSVASASLSGIGRGLNLANPFSGLMPSLDGLKTAGVATLGAITVASVKLASDAEQTQQAFGVMIGDAVKANRLIGDVKNFAAETPFGSKELLSASQQLLAYGTSVGQIVPTLRTLGDVSSSLTNTSLDELVYLFGTLRTQGRAFSKDIYQFTGRGIPIVQELAKVFKVTDAEVTKLVEDGKVGFREVVQAFKGMTAEGGRFGGMMEKQSQTLGGLFESLKDNVVLSLESLGKVIVEEFDLKGLTRQAIDFTKTLKDRVGDLRPVLRELADWAKAIGNALSVAFRSSLAAAEGFAQGLNTVFGIADKAQNLKDWLKGLQFDFRKARDFGVDMAEGVSVGLAKVVDFAEEVAQAIRKIYVEIARQDLMLFKAKVLLLPERDPDLRKQIDAIGEFNRQLQITDNNTELRRQSTEFIAGIDPEAGAKLKPLTADIEKYGTSIVELRRIVAENPENSKRLMPLIERQMENFREAVTAYRGITAGVELRLIQKKPESRSDEFLRMAKDFEALEKSVTERAKSFGMNADEVRKSFAGLRGELARTNAMEDYRKEMEKLGRPEMAIPSSVPIEFKASFGVTAGLMKLKQDLKSQELEIPARLATAEQIGQARELLKNIESPRDTLKREFDKLDELGTLRAFGTDNVSGIPGLGSIDMAGMRGEMAISAEKARKLLELESTLGDRTPKLAGAVLRGSTQAASIEAQFSVAAQQRDPQVRVEAAIRDVENQNKKQLDELIKIANALQAYLAKQGGNAKVEN